jgi:NAD(P)-dependent dehydrogenase (short-subunit alcohol dehydrogenase family)
MGRVLRDRVIVITGGGTGIGAATAVACARAGMHVVVAGRRREPLDHVVGEVQALGRRGLAVECNVDHDRDVRGLIEAASRTMGRIDVLFANAGYGVVSPVLETDDADARAIFETNFWGTIRLLREGVPVLMRTSEQPHVVICSSSASKISPPYYGHYAATKAAQDAVACALRAELRGRGVAVTSVHPTGTRTEFFAVSKKQPGKHDPVLNTPQWAFQTPEHVARCIVRALHRPRAEVWPSAIARIGLGMLTALPSLKARIVRHMMHSRS